MNNNVEDALEFLSQSQEAHTKLAEKIGKAYGGAVYATDLLAYATLKRSMDIIQGFTLLIKNENFNCAAPLLRMQIDNLLRFFALTLVEKPHDLVLDVMDGKELRKIKDKNGKKMMDHYLIQKIEPAFPWLPKAYKATCGYIHLSEKHLFSVLGQGDGGDRSFRITCGPNDSSITDENRLEAIEAMTAATSGVLELIHGWAHRKENPEEKKRQKLEQTGNEK